MSGTVYVFIFSCVHALLFVLLLEIFEQELKLDQKTPLRVLHRRPLAARARVIHTMQSEYIDEHHFRLQLKTQAGTYPS